MSGFIYRSPVAFYNFRDHDIVTEQEFPNGMRFVEARKRSEADYAAMITPRRIEGDFQ